ncbi:MAG: hypothetical protein WCK88_02495 [bacterium]
MIISMNVVIVSIVSITPSESVLDISVLGDGAKTAMIAIIQRSEVNGVMNV